LFVHHYQTDQLLVVRGTAVLIVLQNRRYEYILMSQDKPMVVKIPAWGFLMVPSIRLQNPVLQSIQLCVMDQLMSEIIVR
jgi:hypothetical protein